jgi:hypothetical protein
MNRAQPARRVLGIGTSLLTKSMLSNAQPFPIENPLTNCTALEHDRSLAAVRKGRGLVIWNEQTGHADAANSYKH